MNKCSPAETRKNLIAANELAKSGIDFVPMPALNDVHKKELIVQMINLLEQIDE